MANYSDYAKQGLADHCFRTTPFPRPSGLSIALCSGIPVSANSGANIPELPSANGYARYVIGVPSDIHFRKLSEGVIDNASGIAFAAASGGNWGWVSGIAILDTYTNNVLMYGQLTVPKYITQNDIFTIPSGNEVITFV